MRPDRVHRVRAAAVPCVWGPGPAQRLGRVVCPRSQCSEFSGF